MCGRCDASETNNMGDRSKVARPWNRSSDGSPPASRHPGRPPRPRSRRLLHGVLCICRVEPRPLSERLADLFASGGFVWIVVHDVHALEILRRLRRVEWVGEAGDASCGGRGRVGNGRSSRLRRGQADCARGTLRRVIVSLVLHMPGSGASSPSSSSRPCGSSSFPPCRLAEQPP